MYATREWLLPNFKTAFFIMPQHLNVYLSKMWKSNWYQIEEENEKFEDTTRVIRKSDYTLTKIQKNTILALGRYLKIMS